MTDAERERLTFLSHELRDLEREIGTLHLVIGRLNKEKAQIREEITDYLLKHKERNNK